MSAPIVQLKNIEFISILGLQAFGTLNPLLSLIATDHQVSKVKFFATEKTKTIAERMKSWCIENLNNISPEVIDITEQNCAEKVQEAVFDKIADGEVCVFNANGAKNSMLARAISSIQELMPLPMIIGSMDDKTFLVDPTYKTLENPQILEEPQELSCSDILKIQGVEWKQETADKQFEALVGACSYKQSPVAIPKNSLKHVSINNLLFDFAWNVGNNRIGFVRYLPHEPDGSKRLTRDRSYVDLANGKARIGNLYDREIHLISTTTFTTDQMLHGDNGKLKIYDLSSLQKEKEGKSWSQLLNEVVNEVAAKIFAPKKISKPQQFNIKLRKPIEMKNDSLIVILGTDISATLVAVKSHKMKHLVLLHTKNLIQQAQKFANECAKQQMIESYQLVECTIDGADIIRSFPDSLTSSNVAIDATPGTKTQTVFLSLLGKKLNIPVYYFDQPNKSIVDTQEQCAPLKMENIDPLIYWLLKKDGSSFTTEDECLSPRPNPYTKLLSFLRICRDNKHPKFGSILPCKGKVECNGYTLELRKSDTSKYMDMVLTDPNKEETLISTKKNEWLELLAAEAFTEVGAKNVHARFRVYGSEEWRIQAQIAKDFNKAFDYNDENDDDDEPHLIDIDVIGEYKGSLFVIECKSGKKITLQEAATSISSIAKATGRFTIALLCALKCKNRTKTKTDANVTVETFGEKELCDPNAILKILDDAYAEFNKI